MKPPDANELLRQEGVDALRAAIDGAPAQRVVSIESARKPKRKTSPSRASWLKGAVEDDRGRVLPILANVALALRTARELREAFSFDELQRLIIVDKHLPLADSAEPRGAAAPPHAFTDEDASQVQEWLQHNTRSLKG